MKIKVIQSGSKGNCTIILSDTIKIIIDLGISYKKLIEEITKLNLDINDFAGLLITHNHKDHIKGVETFIKKSNLKLFIPQKMFKSLQEFIPILTEEDCIYIDDDTDINGMHINLIHTSHDAPCSVGYNITCEGKTITYVTDTGYINRKFLNTMINKDMYIIETNHDEEMLMNGPYPRFLKERVISDYGHLSNYTTAKYLKKIVGSNTKNIVLAHISEVNNTKELAYNTIKQEIDDNIKLTIAYQDTGTELIEV